MHSSLQYSSRLVITSISDAIRTYSPLKSNSIPLLQTGKELPKDIDIWDVCASGDVARFQKIWNCTTGAGRYLLIRQTDHLNSTLLHKAAARGHLQLVSYLVEKCSADLNAVDNDNYTALHVAALQGRTQIIYYLIKQGANISIPSTTGNIPLFYYVRHSQEQNILITLSVISLLLPPNETFNSLQNTRKQTILHYACMNQSNTLPLIVSFLLENGADSSIRDVGNYSCWDVLSERGEQLLSQYMVIPKHESLNNNAGLYSSFSFPANSSPQVEIKYQYENFKQAAEHIALRNLLKMQSMIDQLRVSGKENEFEVIKKKMEKSIAVLQSVIPNEVPDSVSVFGQKVFEMISENFNFTNKTARKLLRQGRIMAYQGVNTTNTIYYYYFLFNDVLVLYDDDHIKAKVRGDNVSTYKHPKAYPNSCLKVYSIPNNFGVVEAIQLLFIENLFGVSRKSFTFIFPSDDEKKDFISDLVSSFEYNSQFYTNIPEKLELSSNIIKEGFLIKRGVVLNQYYRVYVRLTNTCLYYYDNPITNEISGKIVISSLDCNLIPDELIIKWSDKSIGRNYFFSCASKKEFNEWSDVIERINPRKQRRVSSAGFLSGSYRTGSSSSLNNSGSNVNIIKTQPLTQSPPSPSISDKSLIITVTINFGRGLAAKDLNGKSDPYVIVGLCNDRNEFGKKTFQTKKVKKTLNPVWRKNNVFEFEPYDKHRRLRGLRFECWDHDYTSKHDFMGQIILDPSHYKPNESYDRWYKLQHGKDKSEEITGDINITISTRYKN